MERKLKIVLCVLVIALIAIISFAGLYTKEGVLFKNNLPEYALSSDFEGKRITSFLIDEGTEEKIYDKDGKEVDTIPDGENEEDYRREEEKINPDENLTSENYKKVKEILDGRLESLNVEEYKVRVDEETGKVIVELADNLNTDTILQYLSTKGDFSLTDSKEGTVLLDKSDIKEAKVLYSNDGTGGVKVFLNIIFNKEGKGKLLDISKEYLKVETENNDTENENSEENENQKKVTLTLEGNAMLTTAFGEEMPNGELPISLGTATDNESLQGYMEQGNFYAMLLNNPEMPLNYRIDKSVTAKSNISENDIYIIIGIIVVISAIAIIYMIYKFKIDGVISLASIIAWIGLLLLVLRYTNTEISLNSIGAIVLFTILDIYLISKMLNEIKQNTSYENVSSITLRTYLKEWTVIITSLILAIVFTFMNKVVAFSFGMTLFYGIISIAISNLVFLRTMLLAKYSNK